MAVQSISDELDIQASVIGRPVVLEIVEERRPVGWDAMDFEVAKRKRKRMVDADERGWAVSKFGNEPPAESAARPVLARAGRRRNFFGSLRPRRRVNAQSFQAAGGSLCAEVVDAEVAFEMRHHRSCFGEFIDDGGKDVGGGGAGGGELRFHRVDQGHQLLHLRHDPALFGERHSSPSSSFSCLTTSATKSCEVSVGFVADEAGIPVARSARCCAPGQARAG